MPPHVLPTHLFGGPGRPGGLAICSTPLRKLIPPGGQGGTWGDWSPREGRLAPKGPDLPQKVLGPTGFPKGKPLWPLFRAFLAGQKGTASDWRFSQTQNRKRRDVAEKEGGGLPPAKMSKTLDIFLGMCYSSNVKSL